MADSVASWEPPVWRPRWWSAFAPRKAGKPRTFADDCVASRTSMSNQQSRNLDETLRQNDSFYKYNCIVHQTKAPTPKMVNWGSVLVRSLLAFEVRRHPNFRNSSH